MTRIIACFLLWNFMFLRGLSETRQSTASLVAILDMQGFLGTVEFHSNPAKPPFEEVLIRVDIDGLANGDPLTWSIWEYPADLTQEDPCTKDKLRTELVNLSELYGRVRTGQEVLLRDAFRALPIGYLFERTLVVQSIRYGWRACALIRSSIPVATYESQFLSPIGGHLAIRQLPEIATSVRSNLLWTDGTTRNAQLSWTLVKIEQSPVRGHHEESLLKERTCSHLWELISSDLTTPLFASGDTTRGRVAVGGGMHALSRTFLVDTNFTSMEAMDLRDIWVVLQWSAGEFVACAPLWTVHPREAVAEFRNAPYVQGFVHLYQPSSYGDATVISINLTLSKRNAAGFGIDRLPLVATLSNRTALRGDCTALALDYFNPLDIDPRSSPAPRSGTTDRFAVGELSAITGSLTDQTQMSTSFYDQYLTLHGPNGVIGRSVVIYEDSWFPLACANLRTGNEEMVASAIFEGMVAGSVTFRQHLQEPFGTHTSIYVDLWHKELANSTMNHSWKIHRLRRSSRRLTEAPLTGCGSLGAVYDPYGVVAGSKSCDCSLATPMRCALGDLGGRLGPISIGPSKETVEAAGIEQSNGHFLVETGLWLAGDFSVIGMMLAIYEPDYGDDVRACAIIEAEVP